MTRDMSKGPMARDAAVGPAASEDLSGRDAVDKVKTIRAGAVFDGPFMESKEVLGGYSLLETDTIDEAVEIARTWPGIDRGWIVMEVRPVMAQ